jgi:hypothetical protein
MGEEATLSLMGSRAPEGFPPGLSVQSDLESDDTGTGTIIG